MKTIRIIFSLVTGILFIVTLSISLFNPTLFIIDEQNLSSRVITIPVSIFALILGNVLLYNPEWAYKLQLIFKLKSYDSDNISSFYKGFIMFGVCVLIIFASVLPIIFLNSVPNNQNY